MFIVTLSPTILGTINQTDLTFIIKNNNLIII